MATWPSGKHSPLKAFDPTDWYWVITLGRQRPDVPGQVVWDQVYSSKRGRYVPVDDPEYVAWCAAEPGLTGRDRTTGIDTEDNLTQVLQQRGLEFGKPT